MTNVFLDTSGLVALVNTDDQWHKTAEAAWTQLIGSSARLMTSSLVLIELADGLSRVNHRGLAIRMVDALRSSSRVEIVHVDERLEAAAWQLFREREDKDWSMTDCVSMTLMMEREYGDVFTADHHFEQAGFNILLKGE